VRTGPERGLGEGAESANCSRHPEGMCHPRAVPPGSRLTRRDLLRARVAATGLVLGGRALGGLWGSESAYAAATATDWADLSRSIRGTLILPTDPAYATARLGWNRSMTACCSPWRRRRPAGARLLPRHRHPTDTAIRWALLPGVLHEHGSHHRHSSRPSTTGTTRASRRPSAHR